MEDITKTIIVKPDTTGIEMAVDYLKKGKVICFKTDTIYGFSCDATNQTACQKILDIKGRDGKPMILLAKDKQVVCNFADSVSNNAQKLMSKLWPCAMSIIVNSTDKFSNAVTAGNNTLAFRVPNDNLCQQILSNLDFPITSTSANLSGEPSLNSPDDILKVFDGKIDLLIDSGVSSSFTPSTIVLATTEDIKILREGAISSNMIMEVIN